MSKDSQKNPKQRATAGAQTAPEALKAQHDYAEQLDQQGDFGLMVAGAFVRGMRHLGYRHTGTALDEGIDNSFQAFASQVHVVLGYDGGSDKKPEMIALIDDGHGMEAKMLRAAVRWGGTHRENDRSGWGRYGYGMKSAAISQGRRYSVYSMVEGGALHKITIDLDDIENGKYTDASGEIRVPQAESAELPEWIQAYMRKHLGSESLAHGTVLVIEKLDRLSFKTTQRLKQLFFDHFGVTYRNILRERSLFVDGKRVEPIDPLFTTAGMWLYDIDEDRAEPFEPDMIEVKDKDTEASGVIRIRYSYMAPTFPSKSKSRMGRPHNGRYNIMKEHRGLIVMRNGRQIDVVEGKCPWTTFVNYDRFWGIEVDFPATLDEEFNITTSKQQVVLSERMWDILKDAGVYAMMRKLRKRFREEASRLKSEGDRAKDGKRPSEEAMEEALRFKRKPQPSAAQQKKSQERLKQEVKKRAAASGMPEDKVEQEVVAEQATRPYKVVLESAPGGVFFRVDKIGGQMVLYLNTAHRFYTDFYAGPGSNPWVRAGLEILLFTIGEGEVYADGDRLLFYETERANWSRDLAIALDRLDNIDDVTDAMSAEEDLDEGAAEEGSAAA